MAQEVSRRVFLVGAAGGLGAVALTACGADNSSSSSGGGSANGKYPVTIKHAFGETEIKKEPKRIATVSWVNQDVLIALGIKPVGMPKNTYGGDSQGYLPWTKEALDKIQGGEATKLYDETDGINFEGVAGTKPDLIVGTYSGMTQDDYNKLKQIAPTIAYPEKPYGTPLERAMTLIGQAVGKEDKAKDLYNQMITQVKHEGSKYPDLKDKTFSYTNFTSDTSKFSLYTPSDIRVQLIEDLGMKLDDSVKNLTQNSSEFFIDVSAEKAKDLKGQVMLAIVDTDATTAKIKGDKLLKQIPAVADNATAYYSDEQLNMAVSAVSTLSVPWAINKGWVGTVAGAAKNLKS
ncbi:MAG: iron-siderophore ABC transporter substrate-binding protein [Micrococcaceae bacterium]